MHEKKLSKHPYLTHLIVFSLYWFSWGSAATPAVKWMCSSFETIHNVNLQIMSTVSAVQAEKQPNTCLHQGISS